MPSASDMAEEVAGLAEEVARLLSNPGPETVGDWSRLERSWPHELLVASARAAMSQPVWMLPDSASVGVVTGSGGLTVRLPNISTMAALVASCVNGVVVVKPGSPTSRSRIVGPAGLARGIGLEQPRDAGALRRLLDRDGFAVLDTELMYGWLRRLETFTVPFLCEAMAQVSLQPCTAGWKVNGVVAPDRDLHLARCRNGNRDQRTLVVSGQTDVSGLVIDDVSTAGTTWLLSVDGSGYRVWSVEPEEIGVARSTVADLIVPAAASSVAVFVSVLDGSAPRAWIHLVAASAGAVLLQAGAVGDLSAGVAMAREVLASSRALAKLHALQRRAGLRG